MKRLATVTSLLLAFAGAASAQPWYGNGQRPVPVDRGQRPYDRDRPYDRGVDEGMRHGDEGMRPGSRNWVVLMDRYSTSSDRQMIPLTNMRSRFHQIWIQGERGAPYVYKVYVEFMNGTYQTLDINRRLRPGQGVMMDLNGGMRALRRIVVYTEPEYGSSYSIFGS